MEQTELPGTAHLVGRYLPWVDSVAIGGVKLPRQKWRRCSACRKRRAQEGSEWCRGCEAEYRDRLIRETERAEPLIRHD